ncbi:hypothetical protein AAES_15268 [Amazona aestiva]|uniref:Uncharacterized protein n=1 Tax=Amazona aestiva TaxID=12930 RepID=A0A0Q3U1X7_AMAAE|nr:hypothetical protein AAES_15268 [Amazona aestiva]
MWSLENLCCRLENVIFGELLSIAECALWRTSVYWRMWSLENFYRLENVVFGALLSIGECGLWRPSVDGRMWSSENFRRLENVVYEEELLSIEEHVLWRRTSVDWRMWPLENFCRLENVVFGDLLSVGECGLWSASVDRRM